MISWSACPCCSRCPATTRAPSATSCRASSPATRTTVPPSTGAPLLLVHSVRHPKHSKLLRCGSWLEALWLSSRLVPTVELPRRYSWQCPGQRGACSEIAVYGDCDRRSLPLCPLMPLPHRCKLIEASLLQTERAAGSYPRSVSSKHTCSKSKVTLVLLLLQDCVTARL